MWFSSWLRKQKRPASPRTRPTFRPRLEALEDRWVPSTLTVTSAADSGAGSLRADIAAARNGDTIVFATKLDGQTITLTSGELLINKSLTIAGPGAGALTVSGDHASRVFEVAKTAKSVTLSGLTISNGFIAGQGGQGGGILVDTGASLTVSNSTLSNNSAYQGAGINNQGTLTVSGSTLSGNSDTYDTSNGGVGGGIYNSGPLTVSNSTLSANFANDGGGIFNVSFPLTISGSTLSGNTAQNGGGIYNEGGNGTVKVSGSTLSGNTAQNGGGIYNYNGTVTISGGSTLSSNTAYDEGGGIYNGLYGTLTVENSSSITGNTAPAGFGADVYNLGVLYLDASSIIGILDGNPAKRI